MLADFDSRRLRRFLVFFVCVIDVRGLVIYTFFYYFVLFNMFWSSCWDIFFLLLLKHLLAIQRFFRFIIIKINNLGLVALCRMSGNHLHFKRFPLILRSFDFLILGIFLLQQFLRLNIAFLQLRSH